MGRKHTNSNNPWHKGGKRTMAEKEGIPYPRAGRPQAPSTKKPQITEIKVPAKAKPEPQKKRSFLDRVLGRNK
ncbi:MAG: hypothetical protein ABIH20_03740 [Candidatus Diapherotrites archaeon]